MFNLFVCDALVVANRRNEQVRQSIKYVPSDREQAYLNMVENGKYNREIIAGLNKIH